MKVTLSKEYPHFYFQHRGYWCKITLRNKMQKKDRDGNSLYNIGYGNTHNKNRKKEDVTTHYLVCNDRIFYNWGEKICSWFNETGNYGKFTLTQEQMIQKAIDSCIREVNYWDDKCQEHEKAYNNITQLEYEIPE